MNYSPPIAWWYLKRQRQRRGLVAPAGYSFLVDGDGYYLTDVDGSYLLGPV